MYTSASVPTTQWRQPQSLRNTIWCTTLCGVAARWYRVRLSFDIRCLDRCLQQNNVRGRNKTQNRLKKDELDFLGGKFPVNNVCVCVLLKHFQKSVTGAEKRAVFISAF